MNIGKLFPIILIVINMCAAIVCLFTGDYQKGIYWTAAAVLNCCVTF